jgi:hypothetical protein
MTDTQSTSLSWCQVPMWGPKPDFCCCQTAPGLLLWGALSYMSTGVPFTISAGPCQHSHSWVQVLWDSWPHFTVSDSTPPQPGGPGPCIYIPQDHPVPGGYKYVQALGSLFIASKSESKLCYDQRSVGQCQASIWGPRPDVYYCQTVVGLLMWGAISDGSVIYNCCLPWQRSHSRVQVLWDSRPYFTVSDSTLPKLGGPGPHIYIPQEHGGPIIPLGTRSLLLFCHLTNWSWL